MTDVLSNVFAGLKDQCEKTRLQSAVELRVYVSTSFVAMSSDAAASVWEGESGINRRLFDLVHSPSSIENLGGILAIKHLLDVETVQPKRNLFRFYNYLKALLPNSDINVMIAASRTFGQVVEMGGTAFGERFMDSEVPAAVGLLQNTLQSDPIVGRYAGVLILKELVRNAPTYFHPHLDLVYDNILDPLRDPCVIVREGVAELLAACLEITTEEERQAPSHYLYKALWKDIHTGASQKRFMVRS